MLGIVNLIIYKMSQIKKLIAKEILDSRGNPTLAVGCELSSGFFGETMVPSGKSTGSGEAIELRDKDSNRYDGLGVLQAVKNINSEINDFVQNKDLDQAGLDEALVVLDGTKNKNRLGANAILGVSMAFAHAVAREKNLGLYKYFGELSGNQTLELPNPCLNIINGGRHSNSGIDLQEFMIVPTGFDTFAEKIQAAKNVVEKLKEILQSRNYDIGLGDEGGFAPALKRNEEALELIVEAIGKAGYTENIKIGIDAAASSFYENGKYIFKVGGINEERNNIEMVAWYENLVNQYPIIFIEDPLAEEDWQGFQMITEKLGGKIKIVGDDLTVTNTERIKKAIDQKAINAVLIKPNQIGTITETIQAVKLSQTEGWPNIMSHRSGETLDTTIADLAIGLGCQFIKSGAPTRPERLAKYDRLIEIEGILASKNKAL